MLIVLIICSIIGALGAACMGKWFSEALAVRDVGACMSAAMFFFMDLLLCLPLVCYIATGGA
jgi:hypothetical protein